MNIRLTTNFDLELFQKLLPETKLFDWYDDNKIDLLIFPGGEDVGLEYYLDGDTIEKYGNLCHTNPDRDNAELKILQAALSGKIKVNKILGVCRGLQFLNVMFGGNLYFDLPTYGINHGRMHKLNQKTGTNLEFMTYVNSLHHQGVNKMGNNLYRLNIDRNAYPRWIATDETGEVYEIVTWLDDKVLGIQFHPEYYGEGNPDKDQFRKFLYSWSKNEIKIER